ncbi:hypothetical protein [Vibrio fluvialis]|uniref:hypothetical protein n=1 Tax=Vibrio fluvialis TaxID=676 RepID=UPI0013021589|nr:hypothetical protein [Vibrio fluvialis]EKO3401312.1 hypothetical protein [Vibrio fluvialis]EKO3438241.1 hypothetical protein [Vibrio fluvialis]EKO3514651.1 hypothetical protein [Vibrio fluvialis]EKO3542437.1 hypothetical protein [Vibrio fluvialis]EKO3918628.1 hypothetical protein [Vibrio fluvialis]
MNQQQQLALFRRIQSHLYDSQRSLGVSQGKAMFIMEQLIDSTKSPEKARLVILILLAHTDARELGQIYRIFRAENLI